MTREIFIMAFLHHQSCECVKSELDLFSLPATQTSIGSGKWVQYKPIFSLTDDSPIEFVVPGHGDEYLDLANTTINIKARILKPDGTKLNVVTKNLSPYLCTQVRMMKPVIWMTVKKQTEG